MDHIASITWKSFIKNKSEYENSLLYLISTYLSSIHKVLHSIQWRNAYCLENYSWILLWFQRNSNLSTVKRIKWIWWPISLSIADPLVVNPTPWSIFTDLRVATVWVTRAAVTSVETDYMLTMLELTMELTMSMKSTPGWVRAAAPDQE